jgi:DNA topoisomerase I
MAPTSRTLCSRYGLNYVESSELDIRRRRCGKGFTYLDADNRVIRDQALRARVKRLAIPPAWTEVCVAQDEKAHIQAIGRDADGRLQYRYHPDWENLRADTKKRRLLNFGLSLGRVRSAVRTALGKRGLTRTKLVAAVVRLMDRALLRPGYEEYARQEGGRGAATLLKGDVAVKGSTILLDFPGKGGKAIKLSVKDALLANVLKQLGKLRGRRLFSLPRDERPIAAQDVNNFLADVAGAGVTAKDFRTFRASAIALAHLSDDDNHQCERSRKKSIVEAADQASEALANTRSVTRSSYIHPIVVEAYEAGELKPPRFHRSSRRGLSKIEHALMRLLRVRAR